LAIIGLGGYVAVEAFELFLVGPKEISLFYPIPNKGHVPTEEEVQGYISEGADVAG